ncbi:MAG: shikimate dehydrogenase [Pseudomonadota bacterium]|nr:shikimate dehydrogenase [Pseudomonadota bacterium]MDQ2703621.1 shikimate dehydrogenase [Pseudomonadota bacterium]
MQDAGVPIVELLRRLVNGRIDVSGHGVLVGLIGRGIQSSRSPVMHEREAVRLGMRCSYVLIDFDVLALDDDRLADVAAAAGELGFHGLNVTHPFKQAVIAHLDALSPEAVAIGAVNTIVFSGGRATGHNTDSWGFAESFREDMQGAALGRVVQFGAGGAGAAVAHALVGLGGGELAIIDSDRARALALAQRMSAQTGGRVRAEIDLGRALAEADGIVNTTPVGMAKYPGLPFPQELLKPRHWVAEVIYFPAETELLKRARALGCRTLSGRGMAIGQAARAFELFTGKTADRHAMAGHFEAAA